MSDLEMMRAMDASGGRGAIEMIRIPKPSAGPGQVRVEVVCSAVEDGEDQVLRRTWVGMFLHRNVRPLVIGWNVAGVVDAVGAGVEDFSIGDAVWGHLEFDMFQKQGAFSEFVIMGADAIAKRPEAVTVELAAALPTVSLTALQALRDFGRLQAGGSVLVIGAGGGIGSASVAIAKRLGAEVVGLCSTKDVDKVAGLGANRVIDRKKEDFLASDVQVDVILDTPSKYSFGQCRHLLKPGGTYLDLHPWTLAGGFLQSMLTSKRCRFVMVAPKKADLEQVGGWLIDGMPSPVAVDSRYPVSELAAALSRRLERDRSGQVVVEVAGNWPG